VAHCCCLRLVCREFRLRHNMRQTSFGVGLPRRAHELPTTKTWFTAHLTSAAVDIKGMDVPAYIERYTCAPSTPGRRP